jgi:hypothetical protein
MNSSDVHLIYPVRCDSKGCVCKQKPGFFTWYLHDYQLIWYEVPKCASSTLKKVFAGKITRDTKNHKDKIKDYRSFAVVRNPFDRIVSNWLTFRAGKKARLQEMLCGREFPKTFADFVNIAQEISNHHWRPQFEFMPSQVDFLLRLEYFEEGLKALNRRYRFYNLKKMVRQNATDHAKYWAYYTPPIIDTVSTMYSYDLARFEYYYGYDRDEDIWCRVAEERWPNITGGTN